MAVYTIYANVDAQNIAIDLGDVQLVSGSNDIYQVSFTFSDEWDSFTKKVVFYTEWKKSIIEILLSGTNIVTIPTRSLANTGFLMIGVYGTGTNNEKFPTVWSQKIHIYEGTCQGYENPPAPDPEVYEEILAAMAGKTDVSAFDDTMEGIFKSIFNYHDNKPYLTRTAPENIRTLLTESLVGGSFAWNQLVDTGTTAVTVASGHKYFAKINGVESIGESDGTPIVVDGSQGDQLHDLTMMFRKDTADYIYSLESAEAGSGIAWLRSYGFFTKSSYPYDVGSVQSVHTINHNGYNLAPIDLRGVQRLDGNNLYYTGDVYESNGTVTRKYAVVDLGTLNYSYYPADSTHVVNQFRTTLSNRLVGTAGQGVIFVCGGGYTYNNTGTTAYIYANCGHMMCMAQATNNYIWFANNNYSSAAGFKAAMSGVYLVYPLKPENETTETAEPFAAIQTVPETEYYTDNRDVPIPVGHESTYLVATPDTPTADGTYTLTCTVTDGVPSYEWQGSGTAQTLNLERPALNLGAVQPVDINTETETESAEEGDEDAE